MEENKKGKNAKKKPFKQTRQLVKMALNDGWTQSDVASSCRVQQSIVSGWKNGSKFGTESILKPLLEVYGHKLRRTTFKVYWHINNESKTKTFYRVEGRIIFSEGILDLESHRGRYGKNPYKFKLIVHYQGDGKFRGVIQSRLNFDRMHDSRLKGQSEDTWSSQILNPLTAHELVEFVDDFSERTVNEYKGDATTFPFLIRQALLNNGFQVEGIVEYPASW